MYFLMFWEHWSMPPQPERVRKAGIFRWGKATLEAFGMLFCHSSRTHLCIVTKLIMELLKLAPINLAGHHIEILAVSVAPVHLLLIEYVKKKSHSETLEQKHRAVEGKGFLPSSDGGSLRERRGEEFDMAWPP